MQPIFWVPVYWLNRAWILCSDLWGTIQKIKLIRQMLLKL